MEKCRISIAGKPVDHALSQRLAVALLSLLIVSIVFNVISLVIGISTSVFGKAVFIPLLLDALILAVCIGIFIGIFGCEVGGYLLDEKMLSILSTAVLGIGFCMLIAMFGCRLVSHPALLIGFLLLMFLIPFAFLVLLASIFECTSLMSPVTKVEFFYY